MRSFQFIHKMGPRAMLSHVPTIPDHSLEAQKKLENFLKSDKPFLSVSAGDDPVTNGIEKILEMAPNAKSAPHIGGGHFFQWTRPKQLSDVLINFMKEKKNEQRSSIRELKHQLFKHQWMDSQKPVTSSL